MMNMKDICAFTDTHAYDRDFWNVMRFRAVAEDALREAQSSATGAFFAPPAEDADLRKIVTEESVIRTLATGLKNYDGATIWAAESDDHAEFVPEGAPIPGFDSEDDFTNFDVGSNKIAALIKVSSDFARDAFFDLRSYINKRMGKSFARAEDRAFVNGTGTDEPHGLLHETEGAETGVAAAALTYDGVIDLFFSIKPEYRKSAVWLMNDRTALALRKLKDDSGGYPWNAVNDTILGKPVRICNEMPDIGPGAKPVLFGDFRYYWIIDRSPVSMRALKEHFTLGDQIAYVGFELLDARLVRRDAVKAIVIE